jgi:hypothetical protein
MRLFAATLATETNVLRRSDEPRDYGEAVFLDLAIPATARM